MLSLKDCADYCDLNDDELTAIQRGAHVDSLEACAMAHDAEQNPQNSRRMLKYLQEYLEYVESKESDERSHEVHHVIDHFIKNHRLI